MSKTDTAFNYIRQFILALVSWRQAWDFVKEHKPWKGLRDYGWFVKLGIAGAVLFGFQFFSSLFEWVSNLGNSSQGLGLTSTMSSFYNNVALENFNWILSGGSKYLILVLLEVLVFHFTRFTISFLTGKDSDSTFNAFINAEIRMIMVAFRCWILETIIIFVLGLVLGIFGFDGWKPFFAFFVQCYFVGFAMIDNYFECYGAKIKESAKIIREFAGASVGVGIVAFALMYVPLIGVLLATTLGAVAATIVMYKLVPPEDMQFEKQLV